MLNNIKVLSFTHFLQGPSAVQMLADVGAEVIKIESPTGAFERHWAGANAYKNGVSMFYLLANRNQRNLSIDLKAEESKRIITKLIEEADVIVENYRPGVMDSLGFGYEDVSKINDKIIYCSCTGYGSDGPYKHKAGQDLLLQSMSGLTFATGTKDSPPIATGSAIVDQHSAVLAAFGILSAIIERNTTGKGKKVDVNLLNAALDLQIEPLLYHLNKGSMFGRSDTNIASQFHPAPYGIYETKDYWITLSFNPITKLAECLESDSLAVFSDADQTERREDVNKEIIKVLKQWETKDLEKKFDEYGIWYADVNDYDSVENDAQVKWNKAIETIDHSEAGEVKLLTHPVKYDGENRPIKMPPPKLGEHSKEILAEIGYSETEINNLINSKVIKTS